MTWVTTTNGIPKSPQHIRLNTIAMLQKKGGYSPQKKKFMILELAIIKLYLNSICNVSL